MEGYKRTDEIRHPPKCGTSRFGLILNLQERKFNNKFIVFFLLELATVTHHGFGGAPIFVLDLEKHAATTKEFRIQHAWQALNKNERNSPFLTRSEKSVTSSISSRAWKWWDRALARYCM
jgi:hypothetical protein